MLKEMRQGFFTLALGLLAGQALAQGATSPTTEQDYTSVEQGLQAGADVQLQGQLKKLGMNPLDIPTFRNLYN